MSRVSIIVPVYNAEDKLERCIDSLLSQTMIDIEVILIDDGSTDRSNRICDEYSNDYNNVKTIHVKNGGVVKARKLGVSYSSSELVMFCDADDYVDSDMVERLVSLKENSNCDLVCSGLVKENGRSTDIITNNTEEGVYVNEKLDELRKTLLSGNGFGCQRILPYVVTKVFNRTLLTKAIEEISDGITLGDDMAITMSYIFACESLYVTNQAYYHYEMNMNSICHAGNGTMQEYVELYNHCAKYCQSSDGFKDLVYYIYYGLLTKYNGLSSITASNPLFMFGSVNSGKIVIYGFGSFGKSLYKILGESENVKVTDITFEDTTEEWKIDYSKLSLEEFDYIVIAILRYDIAVKAKANLIEKGIDGNKILMIDMKYLKYEYLPEEIKRILIEKTGECYAQ